ncbi:MAG TPA: SUMF1/EgtB/PvdO family nonheme iron enzyme [Anaerolineales bacterium]|nr:SUMF1/EgtB/PvdO family nonheme iron enzyme [Anaerolineales bacterium]
MCATDNTMRYSAGNLIANRYQITEILSQHSGGEVYLVFDMDNGQHQVLKRVNGVSKVAFSAWARELERRIHPNLVEVLTHFSMSEDEHYLVLEYIRGESLAQWVQKEQQLSLSQTLRWLAPTLSALEYLHSRPTPLRHGNLTPGSILIADANQVVLAGYQLGAGNPSEAITLLAPERRSGLSDPRSDVYELGACLYYALSGRAPGQGDIGLPDPAQIVPIQRLAPQLSAAIGQVIHKALRPQPEARYANARELRMALGKAGVRWADEEETPAIVTAYEKPKRQRARWRWNWLVGACLLLAVFAGWGGWQLWQKQTPPTTAVATAIATEAAAVSTIPIVPSTTHTAIPASATPLPPTATVTLVPASPTPTIRNTSNVTSVQVETATQSILATATLQPASATALPSTATATKPATHTPTPTLLPTNTRLPVTATPAPIVIETRVAQRDEMPQVKVSAGEFLLGADVNGTFFSAEQGPQLTVNLPTFWIDQHEVTNRQYEQCVQAGACTPPLANTSAFIAEYFGNPIYHDFPVMFVNWGQAKAYCAWAERRLPTEVEWEKAGRGTDGRRYPWGNQAPDKSLVNFNVQFGDVTAVGSFPAGNSPYGAMDMAGNLAEWTDSYFTLHYYNLLSSLTATPNPLSLFRNGVPVIRNGAWNDDASQILLTYRWAAPSAVHANQQVGFRCASSQ